MKNAIIILVHQLPEQVNMFIRQILETTEMDIYIHINKKYDNLRNDLLKDERISITNNNIEITWGGDGLLNAVLLMLKEVRATGKPYGHVLINTGQDLLIKKGLDDYLAEHKGEVFYEGYEQDKRRRAFLLYKWPDRYRQLMDSKWNPNKIIRRIRLELFTRGYPFSKKKMTIDTKEIVFYRNWFWGALPFDVMAYILDYVEIHPEYMEIYRNALVPEEGFFMTLIMRSPFRDRIQFMKGHSDSLTNVLSRSNGHPTVVKYEDIEELDKSPFFFARKFDSRVDNKVVNHYYELIRK